MLIVNFVFCSFLILFFLSFSSHILHFHICTVGIHNLNLRQLISANCFRFHFDFLPLSHFLCNFSRLNEAFVFVIFREEINQFINCTAGVRHFPTFTFFWPCMNVPIHWITLRQKLNFHSSHRKAAIFFAAFCHFPFRHFAKSKAQCTHT